MVVRAVTYGAIGVFLGALPCLTQSAQSQQQQIESHARQAQEFLKSNRPELAAREYSAILALDPANVDARGNLGVVWFFQGNYAKAAPELRGALKLSPTLWKIQALLGMCEKRIGETAGARADLEKAFPQLTEKKLRVESGMELIEIYFGAGDLDQAAAVASALRQLEPENPDIQFTAHRIYSALADESLLSVAMLAPKSARMHQLMAHELARYGDTEGAIAQYREAIKIAPQLSGLHFELAELLSLSTVASDQAGVESEYRAALAGNPYDEKSECRLGEIAARQSDLKSAFAHYSRAVELQPKDADACLGLAKVLVAMNQTEKAQPLLERSIQLEPFNAVTHYHLASVYRSLGRSDDARRELAEFQKLKELKHRLRELYREMRLQPAKQDRADSSVPN
jgi:tetratricopeptide (TPR) repeat protein